MRILVAGGAGFLGSHLVEYLVARGDEVLVVDDLSSGQESNLSAVRNDIAFLKKDISEYAGDRKFDVIVNLASRASRAEWETYPVEVALSNSIGNNNLIKIALRNNSRYLFASTSEVYGNPDVVPTPESYIGRVNSVGSRSPYDEGKRFAESLVKSYEREYGLNSVIIRFFNTYGPRMRGGDLYGRVLDRFIEQALANDPITVYGSGKQTRSFTYVADSVRAIALLIDKGKSGEVYNVGNDKEIPILELANHVLRLTNSNSSIVFKELPPDDPKRRAADITKISQLGWRPQTDLETGMNIMIKHRIHG